MVVSVDYSNAVEANYKSNGGKKNVLIVQGDIFSLPVKQNFFDKLFCIGVLQHTPDPRGAFDSLVKHLKSKGKLVIDVYRLNWWRPFLVTRYWVRPITSRLSSKTLYNLVEGYINLMWPLTRWITKLPFGTQINRGLLIADYTGMLPLNGNMLKEWAILDTFDGLSPKHDHPQTINTVKNWFENAGLKNIEVHYGYNGIEGRGTKE